mmetsp:Transcript_3171/g.11452  ORF Transcript_3171/g.11452 Transcript_3171/m.11452 type:complete len:306 (+) Transcript_3171:2025-2942(+)
MCPARSRHPQRRVHLRRRRPRCHHHRSRRRRRGRQRRHQPRMTSCAPLGPVAPRRRPCQAPVAPPPRSRQRPTPHSAWRNHGDRRQRQPRVQPRHIGVRCLRPAAPLQTANQRQRRPTRASCDGATSCSQRPRCGRRNCVRTRGRESLAVVRRRRPLGLPAGAPAHVQRVVRRRLRRLAHPRAARARPALPFVAPRRPAPPSPRRQQRTSHRRGARAEWQERVACAHPAASRRRPSSWSAQTRTPGGTSSARCSRPRRLLPAAHPWRRPRRRRNRRTPTGTPTRRPQHRASRCRRARQTRPDTPP